MTCEFDFCYRGTRGWILMETLSVVDGQANHEPRSHGTLFTL